MVGGQGRTREDELEDKGRTEENRVDEVEDGMDDR